MSDFNYKAYLKSGKIYGEKATLSESEQVSEKKQGYKDRENESDAKRLGSSEDSAGVGSKKHKQKDERDLSYGKFGKRDAEKKGKNKVNKESVELNEFDADVVAVGAPLVMSVVAAGVAKMGYDAVMDLIKSKFPREDAKYSAEEDIQVSMSEDITEGDPDAAARGLENIINGISKALNKSKEWVKKNVDIGSMQKAMTEGDPDAAARGLENIINGISKALNKSKEWVKKNVDIGSMQKAMTESEDINLEEEVPSSKMKVSELKAKIRENILSTLEESEEISEAEEDIDVDIDDEVEADVDVDVKDEVNIDAEGDDIEIEKKAVKAKVEVGLSPEEEIVQDSLKAAMDAANALGSEKLADQIGNTITFFTRQFVVGDNTD